MSDRGGHSRTHPAGVERTVAEAIASPSRAAHRWTAGGVFGVALLVYLLSAAPTVPFWDAGEYITTAVTMGIPHPPGSPLLTLTGRVLSMLPLHDFRSGGSDHTAFRVNCLAAVSGALSVLLLYLLAVRFISRFSPLTGRLRRDFPVFAAGAISALTAGFAPQFWENAVEVEAYLPALLLSLLAIWLALRWEERRGDPRAPVYLFLSAYVIGLGIAVHLTVLLAALAVILIVFLARPGLFSDFRFWVALLPLAAALLLLKLFAGREILYPALALLVLACPPAALRLGRSAAVWKRTLAAALVCGALFFTGWSVYPTIMVRAAKGPVINEGAPDTWKRYNAYLDREQYGQGNTEEMLRGMFGRKADAGYQFGFMYLRYLLQQFPKWGPSVEVIFTSDRSADFPGQTVRIAEKAFIPVLLWLLILAGAALQARRDPRGFASLFLWFLATSAGLALYLNMQNPQVRERDYFFLGSFQAVMLWLGIGIFGAVRLVQNTLESRRPRHAALLAALAALVLATLAPLAVLSDQMEEGVSNWRLHDRSRDWIPLDYATNLLATCAPGAILFTNGDNDTYPLWYAREVKGVRRDVSIVNLSLLNGPWYIRQLRDGEPRVPISFTDDFIDRSLAGDALESQRTRLWDPEPREVTMAGMTWKMPPNAVGTLPDGSRAGVLSIAAMTVADIVNTNDGRRPIYFTTAVSPDFMIGLFEHLSIEGMAFRLVKDRAPDNEYLTDAPALERNLFHKYQFRGIADPALYKSPETRRMLRNYFIAFSRLSERYLKDGRTADAVRVAKEALRVCDPDPDIRMLLYTIFLDFGPKGELDRLVEAEIAPLRSAGSEKTIEAGMRFLRYGMTDIAARILGGLAERDPGNPEVWRAYTASLFQAGDYHGALNAVEKLRALAPDDPQAGEIRAIIERKLAEPAPVDSLLKEGAR